MTLDRGLPRDPSSSELAEAHIHVGLDRSESLPLGVEPQRVDPFLVLGQPDPQLASLGVVDPDGIEAQGGSSANRALRKAEKPDGELSPVE